MNPQSIILLKSVIRLLVQALELLNQIAEDDFREMVAIAQQQSNYIKGLKDNTERGNLFMAIFFLREILESITNK